MTPSTRPALTRVDTLVDSYRRLADVFHVVLSEQQLDAVLERIADTLGDLIPFDAFTIYQADETRRVLIPLMSRDKWADEIMGDQPLYGEGITGWVVENYAYTPVFIGFGFVPLICATILWTLTKAPEPAI